MLNKREFRAGVDAHLNEIRKEIEGEHDFRDEEPYAISFIVEANQKSKNNAFSILRGWLKGAEEIDIIDPYLMKKRSDWGDTEMLDFANQIDRIIPRNVTINIFITQATTDMRTLMWRKLKEGRTARLIYTDAFHDRFIMRGDEVKLMGASFNGLGRKISALVDLSAEDAAAVRQEILRERVLGNRSAGPPF